MSDAVFLTKNGSQEGPYSREQLQKMVADGQVTGDSLCWHEGLAGWSRLAEVIPDLAPAVPAMPPPLHAASTGSVKMEILRTEFYQMPKITLNNSTAVLEAGAMHYMRGAIDIESKLPSVGGLLKSKLTGEKMVRPVYSGTGEIFLEPTFGEVELLEPAGETWILDKGAFLAAGAGIEVGMFTNKALSGLFSGEGFFQTQVSGQGQVMYMAPGPVERLELRNDTLVVDGSFAVGRTVGLDYKVERATKGLFSSLTSGEGLVNTFRGTGTVLIAPVPNRFLTLLHEFGGLRSLIRSISRK
jgi:uncharacterized protein (AIM24 family)